MELPYSRKDIITIRLLQHNEKELLQEIYHLRVKCRNEFGLITFAKYPFGWRDEIDTYSEHLIALHNDKIIGSGRITFLRSITEHPYFPAIENNLPQEILNNPVAYISRDDVLTDFRGLGIQKRMFSERYQLSKIKRVENMLIDVPEFGYQLTYYTNEGYSNLGFMETDKISWDLGKSILMHKKLSW